MDERNLQALSFNYFSMKCVVDRCNINSLANGVIVEQLLLASAIRDFDR